MSSRFGWSYVCFIEIGARLQLTVAPPIVQLHTTGRGKRDAALGLD